MENSRFENNKVAHGAFINLEISQGINKASSIDSYTFNLGKNNIIRKNSASPQGGCFYFNASQFLGKNISQIIITLLGNFKITNTSLYDFRKEIILYFEASPENLMNIKLNTYLLKLKTESIFLEI
ncbi:MAG: hypothetical protein HQK87_11680 [Nitrospinae bacterium]|nr:hypothetical protein [Nitrospinota bacterium]